MHKNKVLINHIKTYTTFEWLLFIKVLENKTKDDIKKLEPMPPPSCGNVRTEAGQLE